MARNRPPSVGLVLRDTNEPRTDGLIAAPIEDTPVVPTPAVYPDVANTAKIVVGKRIGNDVDISLADGRIVPHCNKMPFGKNV